MSEHKKDPRPQRVYLGDGAYASWDGWQIIVAADRGGVTHYVALGPDELNALNDFAKHYYKEN